MEETIFCIIYLLIVTIAFYIIRKYVFFEPDLDVKKQRIFYVTTFLVGLIVQFVCNVNYAVAAMQLVVGINIFLARKNTDF